MLQIAYGDTFLPQAQTFQAFRHFQDGREDVKDDLSNEQPKMISDHDCPEKVCTLLPRKC